MTAAAPPAPTAPLRAATRATYLAFFAMGLAFASWAARIPQVRDRLGLTPGVLGLVLLSVAAGSLLALPLSGPLVTRLGSRRTVGAASTVFATGMLLAAVGDLLGIGVVMAGLFVMGLATGTWDVAMNVQGALVERRLGRAILSRFHAGYSLGTVAGALVGALMVVLSVPVVLHLGVVAVLIGGAVPFGVRPFLADAGPTGANPAGGPAAGRSMTAWREPRTLVIGVFVLAFAFAEGTGGDWLSLSVIDGYHAPAAVGTTAYAFFLAAMTGGRWVGPALLDRYGRVPVNRALAALGVAGLLVFVFGPGLVAAFAGAVLWGVGIALGFPVGMSAGADEPVMAAGRVSVIASVGYCAFLGGPPLIGLLAGQFGTLRAMVAVAVLLVVATALAGSVRPPAAPGRPAPRTT